jgi:flagellar protein FliS
VQGADAHQLVGLLFDALVQALNQARGALERGEVEIKGASLGKAVRILEEGLKPGLNLREGGELAANLHRLYDYGIQRLTHANLRNDSAAIAEVVGLIEPIAHSWQQIRGAVPARGV